MLFYFSNFIVCLLYTFLLYLIRIVNREKIIYIIYSVHFALIAGLRTLNVGTDTLAYNNIFLGTMNKSFGQIISNSRFVGYELLMKIFASFFNGKYSPFLFFIALVTNCIFFYCAYKFKVSKPFCVAFFYVTFYYFFQSMNMTRQTFAMALCVLGFYLYTQKKFFSSIMIFVCSVLIHSTSIIVLIFPILYKISWTKKKYFALALSTFIISLSYSSFIGLFSRFFESYNIYINSSVDYSSRGGRVLLVLFYSLILVLGIFYSTRTRKYNQIFMTIQGILVISCLLGFLFSSDQLMIRIQMYFEIFIIYYLPMLFFRDDKEYKEVFPKISYMIIPIMVVSIVPLIFQLLNNYGQVIPYKSIF